VVILAGQESPRGREYTVTTSPVLVGGVCALFSAAWETATDLGSYLRRDVPELDPEGRAILRALGAGLTDEAAAHQLGTSLRTTGGASPISWPHSRPAHASRPGCAPANSD